MAQEVVTKDGEIIEGIEPASMETGLIATIARSEIDALIATARKYPRSITVARRKMEELVTLDEDAADEAIYSVPRDGKAIEGPSIRFAEAVAQCWGNLRVASRVTLIDRKDKMVEAEAVFLDAETNVALLARVNRRISSRSGKLFSDDMIITTCNAAQSIARRNAILAGIPKSVWRKPYEAARTVIMGDISTLANKRAEALKHMQRFGLTADQIFTLLDVKGEDDISLEKLVVLRGMYSGLRNGETSVEDLLRASSPDKDASGPAHAVVANPLDDTPSKPEPASEAKSEPAKEAVKEAAREAPKDAPKEEAKPDPEAARKRGHKARMKGMSRKAVPPEYRNPGREAEAEAWTAGHDAADTEIKAKEKGQ